MSTPAIEKTILTIDQLFEGPLLDLQSTICRADGLLSIMQSTYFERSAEGLRADEQARALFEASYADLQLMIDVIRDYTWKAQQAVGAILDDVEIIPDSKITES